MNFARGFFISGLIVYLAGFSLLQISQAQDYDAMMQQYRQQDSALTAQMQNTQRMIVQQNMQNPQVQQMYRQYQANGGTLDFQTFSYNYAATGGFTQEGMARWNQSERNIQQRDQAAINAYRGNQAQNAQAMAEMHQRNQQIGHARGNLLNGTTDYIDPNSGARYNLPHTAQGGSQFYDPRSGETFQRDGLGNYQRGDPNGYWNDLEEDE